MGTAYRGRAVALGLVLAWCPGAWALDPALDVSQYAHTAWKIREGFTKGTIVSIAQTPDGYLWLGTELGLLHFEGVEIEESRIPCPARGNRRASGQLRRSCL